jgi:dGTPase
MFLAVYACQPDRSVGRLHPEIPAPTRSEFQRDRDRIVHSAAFRRLVYKTQVFLNHEGDLFRTRLTHSLEVAQLGRSIARNLQLNEDLVEAIALAHDLGHTPFGHAGQDALNESLKANRPSSAGFEHNLQSLRVVDRLETSYPLHDGLNLTFETREGILKHCSRVNAARIEAKEPNGVAHRFLSPDASLAGCRLQPSLEAQLVNLADEIAYNAHDIDDGVRSGLLTMEQLEEVELFNRFQRDSLRAHSMLQGQKLLFDTIRRMLSAQVYDVTDASRADLQKAGPDSVVAVRRMPRLIHFSQEMAMQSQQLKRFLHQKLYRHPMVERTTRIAQSVVRELFAAYIDDKRCMPVELCDATSRTGVQTSDRAVADYIAGMTDRFALKEHQRITGRVAFEV